MICSIQYSNLDKKIHDIFKFRLILPIRRYLVPTPSSKKVGVEPTPLISKPAVSTNSGRPLGLSVRGNSPVELIMYVLLGFRGN